MRITSLWASIALLRAGTVLAQSTTTSAASSTTSTAPSCTASLITTVCDYPSPGADFAVASDGAEFCWEYCNSHAPCNFVIFVAGNPYTGTGTCWLYPGETFDASATSTDCGNPVLSVYSEPVCDSSSSPTETAAACTATATPSAVASVCGYPTPPDDCMNSCSASEGASACLSQCAQSDSCSYVVFNPHNESNSPYSSGTCWMYPNGTYDASAAGTCSGDPEQFVYENLCPKPSPSSSSFSSATTPSTTAGSGSGSGSGTADTTTGSSSGAPDATAGAATTGENSAPTAVSFISPLAIVVAILLWQGLE